MSKEKQYKVVVISITGHGKKIHNSGDILKESDLLGGASRWVDGDYVVPYFGEDEKDIPLEKMDKASLKEKLLSIQGESADLKGTIPVLIEKIKEAEAEKEIAITDYIGIAEEFGEEGYEHWTIDALVSATDVLVNAEADD